MIEKTYIITEKNSYHNFVSDIGKVRKTNVFDASDTFGILGCIFTLLSECQDIEIHYDEIDYSGYDEE